MRTRFTQPPGVSFLAIGLQTGFARGLEVDNPSGSWLYIPQVETFIPPYTLGWSFGFAYDVSSFDIFAGQSPAGQVSTLQGDPVTIYLTDYFMPNQVGASPPGFISNFTPVLTVLAAVNALQGGGTAVLLAPIPTKRIRLLTLSVGPQTATPGFDQTTPILLGVLSSVTSKQYVNQYVTIYPPTAPILWPGGADVPVSEGLNIFAFGITASLSMVVTISYEVI